MAAGSPDGHSRDLSGSLTPSPPDRMRRWVEPEKLSKLSLWEIVKNMKPGAVVGALTLGGIVFGAGVSTGRWLVPAHDPAAVAAAHSQLRETVMGVADGANRTFLLQRTPPDPAQVKVFLGGLLVNRDRYTISGGALTFRADTIPVEGEDVEPIGLSLDGIRPFVGLEGLCYSGGVFPVPWGAPT